MSPWMVAASSSAGLGRGFCLVHKAYGPVVTPDSIGPMAIVLSQLSGDSHQK